MEELKNSVVSHKKLWEQYTPLMKAVANGFTDAIFPLCHRKRLSMTVGNLPPESEHANLSIINYQGGWNNTTALLLAAQFNRVDIAELLLKYGADPMLYNDNGDNALMVAAAEGHIEMVRVLVEAANADYIYEQNFEMNTAAHLAAIHGHLEIVIWLFENDDEDYLITFDNNEGKNVLHVAAEHGQYEIVEWLVNSGQADVNKTTDNLLETPLMLACMGSSPDHEEIVAFLLNNGADATLRTRTLESALMYATNGTVATVDMVYRNSLRPNSQNKQGYTAFMMALRLGNEPILDRLIELGAKKVIVKPEDKKNMTKLAWMITTEHILFSWLPKQDIFALRATEVFAEEELVSLTQQYVNMSMMHSSKPLAKLVHSAARVDFHFDLFIRMIPHFKTPSTVLNKTLPLFYQNLFDAPEDQLINRLVKLASAINFTIRRHPLERNDLLEFLSVIERMVGACLSANALDEERNVQRVLCCSVRWWDPHFKDDMVEKAQAFVVGPLHNSLENRVKIIFRTGHVSRYVSGLFYNVFKKTKYHPSRPKYLRSEAIHYRYCPAAVFFGEGISKAVFLFLIAYMSILVRSPASRTDSYTTSGSVFTWAYEGDDESVGRTVEILLLIMSLTKLVYEYGQMCTDCTTLIPSIQNFIDHFDNIWDTLDVFNLVLVGFWVVVNHFTALERYAEDGRAALSASTIFLSLRVLQYFSVLEPIGKLLIMLVAMMKELTNFIVVYGAIVVGFSLCLFTLLPDAPAYSSMGNTLLILFGATLANYEENLDTMVDNEFYEITVIIQVAFIFFTAVILLNLIIARMSATHNRIDETSYQEWQFTQAKYCEEYLLLEERNPFCMLPSPLNIIPALSFPIHALHLQIVLLFTSKKKLEQEEQKRKEAESGHHDAYIHDKKVILSIAGTVSDVCMGIVMAFLAPQYELIKQALEPDEDKEDEEHHITLGALLLYTGKLLLTPVVYIFTVCALISDACKQRTYVYVDNSGDRPKFKINYEQREHYQNPGSVSDGEDHITITPVNANNLPRCPEDSPPAIKVHFGNMVLRSAPAMSGGKHPTWSKADVTFPLTGVDLRQSTMRISVVKKNFVRKGVGEQDSELGYIVIDANTVRQWIANGGFTGEMEVLNIHSKEDADNVPDAASSASEDRKSKWMSFRETSSNLNPKRPTIMLKVKAHFPSLLMPEQDNVEANKPDAMRSSFDLEKLGKSGKDIEMTGRKSSGVMSGDEGSSVGRGSSVEEESDIVSKKKLSGSKLLAKMKPQIFRSSASSQSARNTDAGLKGDGSKSDTIAEQKEQRESLRGRESSLSQSAKMRDSVMDYCSGDSLSDDDSSDNEDDDAYMVTGITRHFQSNEETLFNESDKKRIFAFTRKGAAEGSEELAAIVALEGQLTGLAEDVSHTKKSLDTVMREKEELLTQLQQLRMKHDNMLNKHNIADEDDDDEHKEVFLSPRGLNHAVIHDHGDNSDGVQVRRNPMRTGHWISPPPSARSGGKSSAWARAPGTSPPLSARSIGKVRDFPHHNPNPKPMRSPRTGSAKSFSASSSGNSPKGQSPKEAKWSSEKGVETRKVIRAIGTHIDDVHEELGLGADSFKHVPSPAEDRDDKL